MTLEEIITKAIPSETCPQKNGAAMNRRKLLKQRIINYLEEQLRQQFNARRHDIPGVDGNERTVHGVQN